MSMPEKKFRVGLIQATVWKNQGDKGEYKTVSFEKRYQKDGEWKSSNSFTGDELARAIVVLTKAFEYVALQEE